MLHISGSPLQSRSISKSMPGGRTRVGVYIQQATVESLRCAILIRQNGCATRIISITQAALGLMV